MANLRADNLTGTGGRNALDGSLFFGERYTRLELDGSSDFAFGTGDFTIEMWIKIDNDTNTNTIYDSRPSGSNGAQVALFYSGSSNAILFAHGGTVRITGTVDVGADQAWHHIALTRASGSTKLFVDGVQDGSTYSSDTTDYLNPSNRPRIGQSGGSTDLGADTYFRGYISNVRVNKGSALYTANFTPPTEKLTAIDGTVLLCCQDSDDTTQEATGKTITGYGNLAAFSSGDNLVTNGTFDSATTGWTSDGTMSIDSNRLKITNDTTAYRSASQDITVVVGKAYRVSADCIAGTSNNSNFHVGTTSSSNSLASAVTSPVVVRPTVTTLRVTLNVGSNTSGHTALYDNVEVTEVEPPKAPKVLPPVGVDEGVTFDGDTKVNTQQYMYFPTGDTSQRGRGRGVISRGMEAPGSSLVKTMQYIEIQSMGNSIDFGDGTDESYGSTAVSSSTRGITALGATSNSSPYSIVNTLDYVTLATTANATDFGDLVVAAMHRTGMSNNTRGVIAAGFSPSTRVMDVITIATAGNAVDFGDSIGGRFGMNQGGQAGSSTRGLLAGGESNSAPFEVNKIQYITFATESDTQDFGDLNDNNGYFNMGASSDTRAVFAGGDDLDSPYPTTNRIDYVTIATTGNATDFGDLMASTYTATGHSNGIRGVFSGGLTIASPAANVYLNTIQYVTIATTGNASDFGDTSFDRVRQAAGMSDSHGGLS